MNMNDKFKLPRHLAGVLLVFGGLATMPMAWGHEGMDHSAHMAAAAKVDVKRSEAKYLMPKVTLLNQNGQKVTLSKALDDGRPVMLNFIYTSCTTICPVTTQIFTEVQSKLGGQADKLHMVSVSIDPEYDTPKRLLAYAKENKTGRQWDFYTGSIDESIAIQKAFDAYRGDKMNHAPLTLLRAAPGKPWVRLDGFASPEMIVKEYLALAK
jgi:protein SCO1